MNRSPLFILAALLLIASAHAGTLLSGSSLQVQSNYQGFQGLNLVGTWVTTPSVNDYLTIQNADLPAPYGLQKSLRIDIPQPTIRQVFQVSNQVPIFSAAYYDQTFYYWDVNPFHGSSDWQKDCDTALTAFLATPAVGNKHLFPGTSYVGAISGLSCHVQFVVQQSQIGWTGDVSPARLNYDQYINLAGVGQLHLIGDPTKQQMTDSISGVGRATFLGFNNYLSFPLSANNVRAFQPGSVFNVNAWTPYQDSNALSTYNFVTNDLQSLMANPQGNAGQTPNAILSPAQITQVQADIARLTTETSRISGASSSLPQSWNGGFTPPVTSVANTMTATLKGVPYTANIQLVLNGQSFGLFLATGKPQILSDGTDKMITFDEIKGGVMNYHVKNSGGNQGAFVLTAVCSGSAVGTPVNFPNPQYPNGLAAGQEATGTMQFQARSTNLAASETDTCTVSFTETSTHEVVTSQLGINLLVKQQCAEGQETDPLMSGASSTVNVLDSHCQIKTTLSCANDGSHQFQKDSSGNWQCQTIQGSAGGGVPPPAKPDYTWWIICGLAVGIILTVLVFIYVIIPLVLFFKRK